MQREREKERERLEKSWCGGWGGGREKGRMEQSRSFQQTSPPHQLPEVRHGKPLRMMKLKIRYVILKKIRGRKGEIKKR